MKHPEVGVRNLENGVASEGLSRLNIQMTEKRKMDFKMDTGKNSRELSRVTSSVKRGHQRFPGRNDRSKGGDGKMSRQPRMRNK